MVGTGRGEVERNLLKEKEKKEREKQASKQETCEDLRTFFDTKYKTTASEEREGHREK